MRVTYEEMCTQLERVLAKRGLDGERGRLCAKLFADASRDGVYSHGLNRFPSFVDSLDRGFVNPAAEPELIGAFGVLERWNGRRGPGNLNAHYAMNRAIALAKQQGIGCVALSETNHWMRAGNYGWQAAEAGCIAILWTNTMPNLPPWGSREAKLGNNPLVIALPRPDGHLVLDMAMSQFSYGQLGTYQLARKLLPIDGGFDREGSLTRDPGAILESRRPLPIGYWKGSGLALMLDLVAALLSGGLTTHEIGKKQGDVDVSQVFLVFDAAAFPEQEALKQKVENVIDDLHHSLPAEEGSSVRYPGEDTLRRRQDHLEHGIPVEPAIWQQVLQL